MHDITILWFDQYYQYTHKSSIGLPGTEPEGVSGYVQNHWESVLGIPAEYAICIPDFGTPTMVRRKEA